MVIGLTGGIGSGKTSVAKLFEFFGCAVFHSDDAARDIYFEPTVKVKVAALLGVGAYLSETQLDKAYISSKIFNDTALLHQLNAIIHPAVGQKFIDFKKSHLHKIVVKESALFYEAKLQGEVDKIIVVAANDELRIERVIKRDAISREEVLKKMKSQLLQEEKIKLADFVIYNNDEEFLITQVLAVLKELLPNGE